MGLTQPTEGKGWAVSLPILLLLRSFQKYNYQNATFAQMIFRIMVTCTKDVSSTYCLVDMTSWPH